MKRSMLYALLAAVFTFVFAVSAFAETFHPPQPVYVSGTASGLLYFKSDYPAALDCIQGITQYRNDIMKRNGTGRNRNANIFEVCRVSPNCLTIQMYQPTLAKQFAFNVRNGALWGEIPSCYLIPDGKTVIIEDSRPINQAERRDSEDGEGGHHFSLIAHLTDMSLVNPVPFDASYCGGGSSSASSSRVTQRRQVHYHKGSKGLVSCDKDPCGLLMSIKEDTTVIRVNTEIIKNDVKDVKSAVGQATAEEKRKGLGTLHRKTTAYHEENVRLHKKTHDKIGKSRDGKQTTLHEQHEKTHDTQAEHTKLLLEIRDEVKKTSGHTIPRGIPIEGGCIDCHKGGTSVPSSK